MLSDDRLKSSKQTASQVYVLGGAFTPESRSSAKVVLMIRLNVDWHGGFIVGIPWYLSPYESHTVLS